MRRATLRIGGCDNQTSTCVPIEAVAIGREFRGQNQPLRPRLNEERAFSDATVVSSSF